MVSEARQSHSELCGHRGSDAQGFVELPKCTAWASEGLDVLRRITRRTWNPTENRQFLGPLPGSAEATRALSIANSADSAARIQRASLWVSIANSGAVALSASRGDPTMESTEDECGPLGAAEDAAQRNYGTLCGLWTRLSIELFGSLPRSVARLGGMVCTFFNDSPMRGIVSVVRTSLEMTTATHLRESHLTWIASLNHRGFSHPEFCSAVRGGEVERDIPESSLHAVADRHHRLPLDAYLFLLLFKSAVRCATCGRCVPEFGGEVRGDEGLPSRLVCGVLRKERVSAEAVGSTEYIGLYT